jgi:hypothetical protein
LLGAGVPVLTAQANGSKNVLDGGELAATTVKDPVTGPLVVRTAVTVSPGFGVLDRSHWAVVFAGKFWVESDPLVPAMLILLTLTPGAPNAKPPCGDAFAGRVILSVYEVPFPDAVQVSPLAA